MTWLVTGGAGYIGAHVVRAFVEAGLETVVLDNLSTGRTGFVPSDVPLLVGDIRDTGLVASALREHQVEAVVHLAGYKYAGASVEWPLHTYQQNVVGMMSLLEAMRSEDVNAIVFSSSCAVYGSPNVEVVTEDTEPRPESPYGESKLVGEWLLRNQSRVTDLRHVSLRYFNVVGSAKLGLSDTSPHNLVPKVLDALTRGEAPRINGTDYPTPDGTCVRDYVHVADVAEAHVAAARALSSGRDLAPAYNLGSGVGLSVRQVVDTIIRLTGIHLEPETGPRRPGDPARIVASGEKAGRDLAWHMHHNLTDMVSSSWLAWQDAMMRSSLD